MSIDIMGIFDYFNIVLFQCDRVVNVSLGWYSAIAHSNAPSWHCL